LGGSTAGIPATLAPFRTHQKISKLSLLLSSWELPPFAGTDVTTMIRPHAMGTGWCASVPILYCTICETAADVLFARAALPAYAALMLCLPFDNADVLNVATPDVFSVPVPTVALPSMKLTVPVGIAPVEDVTVAVNVTN